MKIIKPILIFIGIVILLTILLPFILCISPLVLIYGLFKLYLDYLSDKREDLLNLERKKHKKESKEKPLIETVFNKINFNN